MTRKKCSKEAIVRILLQCDVFIYIIYYELILKYDIVLQKWEMRAIRECVSPNVLIRKFLPETISRLFPWNLLQVEPVKSFSESLRWVPDTECVVVNLINISLHEKRIFISNCRHLDGDGPVLTAELILPVKRGGFWQPASLPHMHRVSASGWISFVPRFVKPVRGWLKVPRTD